MLATRQHPVLISLCDVTPSHDSSCELYHDVGLIYFFYYCYYDQIMFSPLLVDLAFFVYCFFNVLADN